MTTTRYKRPGHVTTWAVPLLLFLMLLPFLWLLQMSFKPTPMILEFPPRLLFMPTVEHYVGLWQGGFPESFVNSLITSGVSTLMALVIGVPAAYALSRWSGRGRLASREKWAHSRSRM